MGVFAAQNAGVPLGIVGAIARHVAKLFAIKALDCDVFICPVSLSFDFLQLLEIRLFAVFSFRLLFFLFLLLLLNFFTILLLGFPFVSLFRLFS